MRIVVLNPDTIGDFVLRTPAFNAILDRGHDLLLAVRDLNVPLIPWLTPRARAVQYPCNPYGPRFDFHSIAGQEFLDKIRAFQPTLLVVASFQYTQFEEDLLAIFGNLPCAGFDGLLQIPGFPPFLAEPLRKRLNPRVPVARSAPELRKNELLCGAVLGETVSLAPPSVTPSDASIEEARIRLRGLGLEDQPFWAVCAGDFPTVRVKNWEYEKWAELLRGIVDRHGVKLLFVGSLDEDEATKRVRELMGDAASHTASATGEVGGLDLVSGLLWLSRGYIGKDTGPMHLAAAMGKPVLAVFGAGDWPRFVPAATTGRAITLLMPCAGCSWFCHLEKSHCVKDVPVSVVAEAADLIVSGQCTDFQTIELTPDPLTSASIVKQTWERSWSQRRVIDEERNRFMQWHSDRLRDIENLKSEISGLTNERNALYGADTTLSETVRTVATERERWDEERTGMQRRLREFEGAALRESELAARAEQHLRRIEELEKLASELRGVRDRAEVAERELSDAEARCQRMDAARIDAELRLRLSRRRTAERIVALKQPVRAAAAAAVDAAQREAKLRQESAAEIEAMAARHQREVGKLRAAYADAAREREESRLLAGKLRAAATEVERLRARLDQSEVSHMARISDLEVMVARAKADLNAALRVLPELRAENLRLRHDLDHAEEHHQDGLKRQRDEFAVLEADRVERGRQIEALHEHIANLNKAFDAYKGRLALRALRIIGLA